MAKTRKKSASKGPDIAMVFATPEQAALFCYALERFFREEIPEDSSIITVKNIGQKVEINAPIRYFDEIKNISCSSEFNRKSCSQFTATSR